MDFKEIKREAVEHYDRMIAWAKTQVPKGQNDMTYMEERIGETYSRKYCSFCQNYFIEDQYNSYTQCSACPLYKENQWCGSIISSWSNMHKSKLWSDWLLYASALRDFINDINVTKYSKEEEKLHYEPDRLVYYWNREDPLEYQKNVMPYKDIKDYSWDFIEPVHKRWNELTDDQRAIFTRDMDSVMPGWKKFRVAYRLITGEMAPILS